MKSKFISLQIMFQFLLRDAYVYKSRFGHYIINAVLCNTVSIILTFGYLAPGIFFQGQTIGQKNSLFIGNVAMTLLALTFSLAIPMLFDFEKKGFITYQIINLNYKYMLTQRFIFNGLYAWVISLPFFPIAKLILQDRFDTNQASWVKLFIILFVGCAALAAYNLMVVCTLKRRSDTPNFWIRVNFPLLFLGGFWVPFHAIKKISPFLGTISYLNPFLYLTEGLRSALLGTQNFTPFWICFAALSLFAILFLLLSWHFFHKRMDCV